MPPKRRCIRKHGLGALALLLLCGCPAMQSNLGMFGSGPVANRPPAQQGTGNNPAEPTAAHNKPSVLGAQLNLGPGETAAERALDLSHKLTVAEEEKKTLSARVRQLESLLEERDRALVNASKEIQEAGEEMERTRADLKRWKQELSEFRDKLRSGEKENLATLQSIVTLLEQLLERDKPVDTKHEPGHEEQPRNLHGTTQP